MKNFLKVLLSVLAAANLHGGFRGRQAELCEDGQELPDERQQGVQLR